MFSVAEILPPGNKPFVKEFVVCYIRPSKLPAGLPRVFFWRCETIANLLMSPIQLPDALSDYFAKSSIALSVSSPEGDLALALVNRPFCELTGYSFDEVVGRNCRFLQGNSPNTEAREQIRAYLKAERRNSLRVPIVNFRKDGTPFVNLLFMSRLRNIGGAAQMIFASQFDVSRAHPDLLREYDETLSVAIQKLTPVLADTGVIFAGSLAAIANTASTIAQAKLTLNELDPGITCEIGLSRGFGANFADGAAMNGAVLPVVGIGASAGGLEALREMLSVAQAPTGMAFVIVQHLDPNHESMLAQLLDRHTSLQVLQCDGGEKIRAETVYIIPPGHGLAIHKGVLELTEFAQPRGLRRPIDDFFVSLAQDQQEMAACVILSGTGADGTTGLRAIKEHGGVCLVQDPETARYDGMPQSAVGTGLVDYIKAPGEILDCLGSFFGRRATGDMSQPEPEVVADHLDNLCRVLRQAVGHDFSGYKRSTLGRRVERRMQVLGIDTGRAYLDRIRSDNDECDALFRDVLINVTRFFRDTEAFETLRARVIQPLVLGADLSEEIRVWVPGCSSGEEAYTIAMLFAEEARLAGVRAPIQIFATDIDEHMLEIAREGSYPASALADIPYALRERYAIPHGERFSIAPAIRDMIRFSNHSIVKDPPFSRIDLVSLRNLLIYFDDRLQQSVMPLLHYAIRPGGWLFLGPSESIGRFETLFETVDHQARLFERRPGAPTYPIDLPSSVRRKDARRGGDVEYIAPPSEDSAAQRLLDRYVPPSFVLDRDGMIRSAYGKLGRYFEFPVTREGDAGALSLARAGLRPVLSRLLREVREKKRRLVVRGVDVTSEFGTQRVDVVVEPIKDFRLPVRTARQCAL